METTNNFFKKGALFTFLAAIFLNIANAQTFRWAEQGSSQGFEYGNAISADDSGNVYFTGQIEYTAKFDSISLVSNGKHDILLGKYSTDGVLRWVKHAGGTGGDVGWGIGIDTFGNIYHTGEYENTAGFQSGDSLTSAGLNDIFISKYSTDGSFIWAKSLGGQGDDKAKAIAVDANGNSYVTGYFSSNSSFGNFNLTSSNSSNDIFIAKVNSQGTVLWAKNAGGTKEDRGKGIVLDGLGNVYVTGTVTQSAVFNSTTLNVQGNNNLFVAKYDTNGVFKWVKGSTACCDTTRSNAITADENGNVYISGYFKASTTIGSFNLTSSGSTDIFVAKYDPNGNVEWVKQAGGPYEDMAYGCSYDKYSKQLYVTGQIDDHGMFGTIYVGAAGNRDVFIASYDENGNEIFARPGGSNQRDAGQAITSDTLGNIYTSGFFTDTASFGSTRLQGYELADFFVAKMTPAPAVQPTSNATSIIANASGCNNIQLNFVSGNGARRLIVARAGGQVNALPVDGNIYSASTSFGQGTDLGSGNYVVYSGTDSNAFISGISSGITYYFAVIEFNGFGFATNYLTTGYPTSSLQTNSFNVTTTSSNANICLGGTSTLRASAASSFLWSPATGLSSLTDIEVLATPQTTTTYNVIATDSSGCTASSSITVIVNQNPIVSFVVSSSVCENSSPILLTGGNPSGGSYTGTGVTAGVFNPTLNGTGKFPITYTYTDSNNCRSSSTDSILVLAKPNVSLSTFSDICVNESAINLTGGLPTGGSYSGNGVIGTVFSPTGSGAGLQTVTYTYMAGNGCSASATTTIKVNDTPSVVLAQLSTACVDNASLLLSGGQPLGGVYSGTQVTNGIFNPAAAGIGNYSITYSYADNNGCQSTANTTIDVVQMPVVTLSSLPNTCSNSSPFTLTGGIPSGGIYTGLGVTGSDFNPTLVSSGTTTILYTYTSPQGCASSSTNTILVNAAPTIALSGIAPRCADSGNLTLVNGTPIGGTYSGNGILGNVFSSSIAGTYVETYRYTGSNGCTSLAQTNIIVNPIPIATLNNFNSICVNSAPITLNGGQPIGGIYGGSGVSGGMFNPAIGSGLHVINYTATNSFGCSNSATSNILVNPAPTVNLGRDTLVCSGAGVVLNLGNNYSGVLWSTGATSNSITVDSSGVGLGSKAIAVTVSNNAGCLAKDTIIVTFDNCTNINDVRVPIFGVYVYPNPFDGAFHILCENPLDYSIYDVSGRLVESRKDIIGNYLTGESLTPGSYFIEFSKKDQKKTYHLIKASGK